MKRTPFGVVFERTKRIVRAILLGDLDSPTEKIILNPNIGRIVDVPVAAATVNISAYDAASAIAIRLTGTPGTACDIVFPEILESDECMIRWIINETDDQQVIRYGGASAIVVVRQKVDPTVLFGDAVATIADGTATSAYPHEMQVRITADGVAPLPGYSEEPIT